MTRSICALIFLLSHRLDASRQFFANFLVISNYIRHLNFTGCFRGKGLALDLNNDLQTFPFLLSLGTLHSDAYRACKLCISSMALVKNSLGTFYFTTTSLSPTSLNSCYAAITVNHCLGKCIGLPVYLFL